MINIYCRVSSEQHQGDGNSLAEQQRVCTAAAAVHSKDKPTGWIDRGVSGGLPLGKRPEGGRLLGTLQKGDMVIAAKMDRLFRSASDALTMAERWQAQGIDLVLLDTAGSQPIMSSPAGKMFFTMLAAFAEFERARLRERIMEGKASKAARGGAVNRPRYGFKAVGKGKAAMLAEDEGEMKMIRLARGMRAGGLGPDRIANALYKKGYRNRLGTKLSPTQVTRILEQKPRPAELAARRRKAMAAELDAALGPVPPRPELSPEDAALDLLRSQYAAETDVLAVLTASDPYSYQRASAALGDARLGELKAELGALVRDFKSEMRS